MISQPSWTNEYKGNDKHKEFLQEQYYSKCANILQGSCPFLDKFNCRGIKNDFNYNIHVHAHVFTNESLI